MYLAIQSPLSWLDCHRKVASQVTYQESIPLAIVSESRDAQLLIYHSEKDNTGCEKCQYPRSEHIESGIEGIKSDLTRPWPR